MLVMLPRDTSKLLAKWQGPFEVVRKLGPTTYEVAHSGKRRSRRVLHVNLLKKWHERLSQVADAWFTPGAERKITRGPAPGCSHQTRFLRGGRQALLLSCCLFRAIFYIMGK